MSKDKEIDPHEVLVALLLVQGVIERRSEAFFQPHGLTGAQFNILNLLAYHDGELDQAQLVEKLLVGKSSISIVLNRMVKSGLLTRAEHSRDRRQVVLHLTAKGRTLWRKISPRYEAGVSEVFGSLSAEKRKRFLADLEAIDSSLNPETVPLRLRMANLQNST